MLRHRTGAASASGPHPATYILFRPPSTPRDDELFATDMELSQPRTLNYKMSCPALLGTASRKLERINEDRFPDSDPLDSDEDMSRESIAAATPVQDHHVLSKKRSFLLVDVLDSVEGRPSAKRLAVDDSTNSMSSQSISINGCNHTPSIRRQKSDFDMLYSSSKTARASSRTTSDSTRDGRRTTAKALNIEPKREVSIRGRQPQLRSKKSLLALSLEQKRASSPSKSRLDQIDIEQVTSFDALLTQAQHFKSTATVDTVLGQLSSNPEGTVFPEEALSEHSQQISRPKANDFSVQTARLKAMPGEKTCESRSKPLRHAKSARDILQKYSVNRQDVHKMPQLDDTVRKAIIASSNGPCVEKTIDRAEKRAMKEASLRSGLRNLLGMKKKRKGIE